MGLPPPRSRRRHTPIPPEAHPFLWNLNVGLRYMPYVRSSRRPRKFSKKTTRRAFKRSFTKRRYNRKGQRMYRFVRYTGGLGTLTINNTTTTNQAYNFSLNDLPNSSEFTSLFDMYKINAVKITFSPQMTENISLSPLNNAFASSRFFSAIDYNDSTAPTSTDELRQYSTCKMTPLLKKHTRMIFKPKILDSSSYTLSTWIASSSPSTNYFGLKVSVEPFEGSTITTMIYKIECKFYMSFKNVL